MKVAVSLVLTILFFSACKEERKISSFNPVDWKKRSIEQYPTDSLMQGSSYLSVYSHIYGQTEHITHNLTATVSMRNVNRKDTVYIDGAEYYNTKGNLIRSYFDHAIFIAPLETVEIVIDQVDKEGGSGANFLFDWRTKTSSLEPLFESVMISTTGQQGLSFSTQGKRIK